jgi:integrase
MPRLKLTAANVATLPAAGERTDYRDTLLPGLVLRVTPTVRTWVIEYHERVDGRRRGCRWKLGHVPLMGLAAARTAARDLLSALDRGAEPANPDTATLTVTGLVERCLADLTLRPSTRKSWEGYHEAEIRGSIGSLLAATLTRGQVREWAKAIKVRSGWTAKHAFEVLRRAYSWGLEQELLAASPCDRMALPFEGYSSERVMSAEELWALLRAIDPRWIIPGGPDGRSKSGRAHGVPLVPAAIEVVKRRLQVVQGQHLFPVLRGPRAGQDVPMPWASKWAGWLVVRVARAVNARRRRDGEAQAPVPRWTLHGFRHSIATHMREDLGIGRDVVSLVLSHTQGGPRVTGIYDRAEKLAERRAALLAWSSWLAGLGQESNGGRVLAGRWSPPGRHSG